MRNGFAIIDSDRHLMEPADLFVRYMPKKWGDRVPYGVGQFSATTVVDGIQNNAGAEFNGKSQAELRASRRKSAKVLTTGFADDIHWRSTYYKAIEGDFGPEVYVADMDRSHIDAAVCFGSALLYFNWRDRIDLDLVTDACRAYNDWLRDFCDIAPKRLYGIAAVPMQDPERAAAEAIRAIDKLGHVGVYLRPNPLLGRSWHDPVYDRFWATMAELGRPVCFHEGSATNMPQARLPYGKTVYARHAMSHPFEQMLACLSMSGLGVLERHPTLKVFHAECTCGWVPFWLQRLDFLHEHKLFGADSRLKEKPSFYFKRQCMTSCESGEETAPYYERFVGLDRLLWASDYPHPDEIDNFPDTVLPMIEGGVEMSQPDVRRVLWDNPNGFFDLGLDPALFLGRENAA